MFSNWRKTQASLAATLIGGALLLGIIGAQPAFAYLAACGDPVTVDLNLRWDREQQKFVQAGPPILYDAVSHKRVYRHDKAHTLKPDASKSTDGFFTIPVPERYRNAATRIEVQYVSPAWSSNWEDGHPDWMTGNPTFRPWGGTGGQVWATRTTARLGWTIHVGIPNSLGSQDDSGLNVSDDWTATGDEFMFEVVYYSRIDGKKQAEAFAVVPRNPYDFGRWQGNSLTNIAIDTTGAKAAKHPGAGN